MGAHPRLLRSPELHFLLRALSVVAAILVLCVSGRASAATLLAVPMCGERGESIAAPPIFRANDSGSIVASPCHHEELDVGRSVPLAPERVIAHQAPERVLGFAGFRLTELASCRSPIVGAEKLPIRSGFQSAPFRPPRG